MINLFGKLGEFSHECKLIHLVIGMSRENKNVIKWWLHGLQILG